MTLRDTGILSFINYRNIRNSSQANDTVTKQKQNIVRIKFNFVFYKLPLNFDTITFVKICVLQTFEYTKYKNRNCFYFRK